jgi:hypothetical protein
MVLIYPIILKDLNFSLGTQKCFESKTNSHCTGTLESQVEKSYSVQDVTIN